MNPLYLPLQILDFIVGLGLVRENFSTFAHVMLQGYDSIIQFSLIFNTREIILVFIDYGREELQQGNYSNG